MMKMTPSDQERIQLEEAFQMTRDFRLRARSLAVPMAAGGRCPCYIAGGVGISVRTVQGWLKVY
jgi:hypothetical protein